MLTTVRRMVVPSVDAVYVFYARIRKVCVYRGGNEEEERISKTFT